MFAFVNRGSNFNFVTVHVQPLCLPTPEEFKTKVFIGHYADIAGWGYTKFGEFHYINYSFTDEKPIWSM